MTGEAARSPPHEGEGSPEPDYPPQKLYASLVSRLSGPYRLPSIDKRYLKGGFSQQFSIKD